MALHRRGQFPELFTRPLFLTVLRFL